MHNLSVEQFGVTLALAATAGSGVAGHAVDAHPSHVTPGVVRVSNRERTQNEVRDIYTTSVRKR